MDVCSPIVQVHPQMFQCLHIQSFDRAFEWLSLLMQIWTGKSLTFSISCIVMICTLHKGPRSVSNWRPDMKTMNVENMTFDPPYCAAYPYTAGLCLAGAQDIPSGKTPSFLHPGVSWARDVLTGNLGKHLYRCHNKGQTVLACMGTCW